MVQIEEVYKNIYRIGIPLTGNPLKELNSYYIKGDDRDVLIDTGFRFDDCFTAMTEAMEILGSDPARRDIILTHFHADHSGQGDLFVGPGREMYMSDIDCDYIANLRMDLTESHRDDRYVQEGFGRELLREQKRTSPSHVAIMPNIDKVPFHRMHDGDHIKVGEFDFEWMVVPGHTPGNSMLFDREHGILFSGDHVLFTITPNITYWPDVYDSLGEYLDNLRRVRDLPVKMTFPGHRQTGDFAARIDELLAHHEARLAEALKVITENPGLCGTEIAGKMTWRIRAKSWEEFPIVQKWFAVGECMSHLDYLEHRGKIRNEFDGTHNHWYAV